LKVNFWAFLVFFFEWQLKFSLSFDKW
jgi:hypothetical protein